MQASSGPVLCFGEALWDLLPGGPQLGGAPLNLAYRLGLLGQDVRLVTRVGRDELGQVAILRMAELGMETDLVQYDDRFPTGSVDVQVGEGGQTDFTIRPEAAYDRMEVTYELLELAQRASCLCFGTVALRTPGALRTLQRLLAASGEIPRFLDLNLRKDCFTWALVEEVLGQATLVKMNGDEARQVAFGCDLAPEPLPELCAALLRRWSWAACVVTLGEHGAFAAAADGAQVYDPGYEVPVVDTCGSGDAFAAGFLHSLLGGRSLAEACRLGNELGALVTMQAGATEPLERRMIKEFEQARQPRIQLPALAAFEVRSGS